MTYSRTKTQAQTASFAKDTTPYGQQLVALGRTLQTLREEENVDVLIDTTVSYLQQEIGYRLIWIGLYDRREHRLYGKGGAAPEGKDKFLHQQFALNPGDLMEQVTIQQRPLRVPDLREETRAGEWQKVARDCGVQGTTIFPILYKDRCLGIALLGSHKWGEAPKPDEKAQLSIVLGELGTALFQIEEEWQRQQAKRPHEPLLAILSDLRSQSTLDGSTVNNLDYCLEVVVDRTHRFLVPSRTNIYWFEQEGRYFWRRVGNRTGKRGFDNGKDAATGITVREVSKFYQALQANKIVSIGEAHSSLKADDTARLMAQIKARSLLAAPICSSGELLGFLAVEGTEPRIWNEEEKQFLLGAAELVGLSVPLSEMEATIKQEKLDRVLMAGLTHAITSSEDWQNALQQCGMLLCDRLAAERCWILLYNPDLNQFEIAHQHHSPNRRPVASPLPPLSPEDWQHIEESSEAIAVENWSEESVGPFGDVPFVRWQTVFWGAGVRSVVMCHTSIGNTLEGLLVVGHEAPRAWSRAETILVRVVAQQIGLLLHQWQLQGENDRTTEMLQMLQWGLSGLQQTDSVPEIERLALEQIAKTLEVPLVALIGWKGGQPEARLLATVASDARFDLNPRTAIPWTKDAIMAEAIATPGIVGPYPVRELPLDTQRWIGNTDIETVRLLALHTAPEHQPTGVVLVGDVADRYWPDRYLDVLGLLVGQLARSRRDRIIANSLYSRRTKLERLNWYKQRRLETLSRSMTIGVKQLTQLDKLLETSGISGAQQSLQQTHYQQILRQLTLSLEGLNHLVRKEQWDLTLNLEPLSVASPIKHILERADPLLKQRQIWIQVHREGNVTIRADRVKLELVLYELLLNAIARSPKNGRIDIWYRPIESADPAQLPQYLELSITDRAKVDRRILADLKTGRHADLLAYSPLDRPPGLYLHLCQQLMLKMGGKFDFYRVDDGRVVSRLIVPIVGFQ